MKLSNLIKKFLCLGCTSLLVVGNALADNDIPHPFEGDICKENQAYILEDNNITDFSALSNRSFHVRDKYMSHIIALFYKCRGFVQKIKDIGIPKELSPKLNIRLFRIGLIFQELEQHILSYCDYMESTSLDASQGYPVEENDECINILYDVFFGFERIYSRMSRAIALTAPYEQYDNLRANWGELKKELKYRTIVVHMMDPSLYVKMLD